MPGESVNIFEVNRRKASERDSITFNLSVILQDVDYFGGILNGIKVTVSLVSIISGKTDNCFF